ncbi:MAG: hypothetical protein ACRC5M_00230 [Anaeroplasmataceae bacterium]
MMKIKLDNNMIKEIENARHTMSIGGSELNKNISSIIDSGDFKFDFGKLGETINEIIDNLSEKTIKEEDKKEKVIVLKNQHNYIMHNVAQSINETESIKNDMLNVDVIHTPDGDRYLVKTKAQAFGSPVECDLVLTNEQLIEALKSLGYTLIERKKEKKLTLSSLAFLDTYLKTEFDSKGSLYVEGVYFLHSSRLYVMSKYKNMELDIRDETSTVYVLKIEDLNGIESTLHLPKKLNKLAFEVKEVDCQC